MAGLGQTLREARLARNLTLEEVERATNVRKVFLWALEAERYDLLPARVYTQGFVQLYARLLALEPRPLLRMLPPEPRPAQAAPRQASGPPWALAWLVPLAIFLVAAFAGISRYQQAATAAPPSERLFLDLPAAAATPALTTPALASPGPSPTATARAPAAPTATPPPTPTPVLRVVSVVGRPLSQAIQALEGQGFQVASEERWSREVPKGVIIDQRPTPGQVITPGGTITIIVSKGPQGPLVPQVVGKPEAEARRLIAEAGLQAAPYANYQGRADLSEQVLRTVCVGCVLSTTPQPGADVPPGTQVFLAVRKE